MKFSRLLDLKFVKKKPSTAFGGYPWFATELWKVGFLRAKFCRLAALKENYI